MGEGSIRMSQQVIYRETFDKGPGQWKVGKDKEDGSYNRNVFGKRGEGLPLEWSAQGGRSGGFASSESPWYFDSNHGEFMWFYMLLIGPMGESWAPYVKDLRNARVQIVLRGRDLDLKGTRLYLWIQGNRGPHIREIYNPGDPLVNWALTSQPIKQELLDGQWHDVPLTLSDDENKWSQMGLLNRGLPRKIIVEQSLTFATGTLSYVLNAHHRNFGFILGGVDPSDPPTGRLDVDEISISTRTFEKTSP
jgi:hypothetical protein